MPNTQLNDDMLQKLNSKLREEAVSSEMFRSHVIASMKMRHSEALECFSHGFGPTVELTISEVGDQITLHLGGQPSVQIFSAHSEGGDLEQLALYDANRLVDMLYAFMLAQKAYARCESLLDDTTKNRFQLPIKLADYLAQQIPEWVIAEFRADAPQLRIAHHLNLQGTPSDMISIASSISQHDDDFSIGDSGPTSPSRVLKKRPLAAPKRRQQQMSSVLKESNHPDMEIPESGPEDEGQDEGHPIAEPAKFAAAVEPLVPNEDTPL